MRIKRITGVAFLAAVLLGFLLIFSAPSAAIAAGGPPIGLSNSGTTWTVSLPAADPWEVKETKTNTIICGHNYGRDCNSLNPSFEAPAGACIYIQVDWDGRHGYNSDDYEACPTLEETTPPTETETPTSTPPTTTTPSTETPSPSYPTPSPIPSSTSTPLIPTTSTSSPSVSTGATTAIESPSASSNLDGAQGQLAASGFSPFSQIALFLLLTIFGLILAMLRWGVSWNRGRRE